MKKIGLSVLLVSLAMALSACGGGGGSSSTGTAAATYAISGAVLSGPNGLAGVTVNLTGGTTASATTDASGSYSFKVANGSYAVTSVKGVCSCTCHLLQAAIRSYGYASRSAYCCSSIFDQRQPV